MNKSMWGILVIMLGVVSVIFIVFFQSVTNSDEHNSQLIKEVAEAAMWDAFDYSSYKVRGDIRIDREKFVENFVRRFAENSQRVNEYQIEFLDISESPPKVSVRVSSSVRSDPATGKEAAGFKPAGGLQNATTVTYNLVSSVDAILEVPY